MTKKIAYTISCLANTQTSVLTSIYIKGNGFGEGMGLTQNRGHNLL